MATITRIDGIGGNFLAGRESPEEVWGDMPDSVVLPMQADTLDSPEKACLYLDLRGFLGSPADICTPH